VKSISLALDPVFSLPEREQVHSPLARRPQEHVSETTLFSVDDFSQLQCIAACLPQLHLASAAQTQPAPSERPQQVFGTVPVGADIVICGGRFELKLEALS